MKKILILLIIPFLLGGCYDYNDLDDLAIVSGIGIDYEDDSFKVALEILSTKKQGDSSSASSSTYVVSGSGKTVTEAFADCGNYLDKVAYFDHIEVVVISKDIAYEHLKEASEYLIRSAKFRNEFYMVMAKDCKAEDIISATSEEKPVAATYIVNMLENSNDSNSSGYYAPFTKTLRNFLTDGEDAMMAVLKLEDKEITLDGLSVFKDFELKYTFETNQAAIINLLNNFKVKTVLFESACNNKASVISIYESKVEIKPDNNKLSIKAKLNGRIKEENCGYDLKEAKSYEKLEKEFTKTIEKEMEDVLKILQGVQSNALSIGKKYYNNTRKKEFLRWTAQEIKFDLDLKINKKGLIFEVNDESK